MATLIIFVDGTIPIASDFNTNFQALNAELAAMSSTVLALRAQMDEQVRVLQAQERVLEAVRAQMDEQARVIGDVRRERRAED